MLNGTIPLTTALEIARAKHDDENLGDMLEEACKTCQLKCHQITDAKRLIEKRLEKGPKTGGDRPKLPNSADSLVKTYQREVARQHKPMLKADHAPYPTAPLNLTLGFDLETFQIPLEELMPSRKVPDGVMTTRKFKQIVSLIREIGLIEPISVIKPDPDAAGFLLLYGNLRVLALKELGQDTAHCMIARDFEAYT